MENLCCQQNEELEKREYATRMVRDLAGAVKALGIVREHMAESMLRERDDTVSAILDKIKELLGEV